MRNVIRAALVVTAFALAGPVAAQTYGTALEAYERGDYAAALSEFRLLAEHGDASAQSALGSMYHFGQGVVRATPLDWATNMRAGL